MYRGPLVTAIAMMLAFTSAFLPRYTLLHSGLLFPVDFFVLINFDLCLILLTVIISNLNLSLLLFYVFLLLFDN